MARLDPVVAGDVNVTRGRTLTEFGTLADGTGEDVATVVAHIWRAGVDPVELVCDIDDPENCVITIDFGGADGWLASRPAAGPWLIEYQATFTDGLVLTVPGVWPDEIVVRADHDPVEE